MGLCASTNAAPAVEVASDQAISEATKSAEAQENKVSKLLLLGAGASGKSTLFKQMISIYGKGFSELERKTFTSSIFNQVINAMKTLVKQSNKYGAIDAALADSVKAIECDMKEDQPITEELAHHIKLLWADKGIQETFHHQAEYQLTDSAKYFFDRIDVICQFQYIPSEQDVLRSRAPTTGIVESQFSVNGHEFRMFDVGGQRNERKKWIHCFENVTAVLFVAAISEYNQILYEDETQNRMVESLTLFDEISNSKYLRKTAMILFLNKRDIFQEKLPLFPLAHYFKEYSGPNTYECASEWIQQQFEQKCQDNKQIYTHITCATDANNVKAIFSAVSDIIVRTNMNRVGMA